MLRDFGLDLKYLRESKNITIAEIAAQTRINPKFITYMEEGNFDFQPDTYIRAFLKEYAKSINEDPEHMLNDYSKAKSGFYSKRKKEASPASRITLIEEVKDKPSEGTKKNVEAVSSSSPPKEKTQQEKYFDREPKDEISHKTLTQKILLVLVIIAGAFALYYLYKTLNEPDKHSSSIKPKSFSEISEDYESKIKGKHNDSAGIKQDSLSGGTNDSLKLTVKAYKELRVKIYIDEKRIVEDVVQPRDSLNVSAMQQFRFSASSNSALDLYLNGKVLKKPSSVMGNTIKNLVIKKEGIVSE